MIAPPPPPLRLLRPDEAPVAEDDVLVRPRATPSLVVAILMFALAGLVIYRHQTSDLPLGVAIFIGGFGGLVGWVGWRSWRKSLRPDAWLMAIGPARVLIRFRSFLNDRFPPGDPQIVELPLAAVAAVRRTRRHVTRPSGRSTQHRHYAYLDFRLHPTDLEPLRQALAREGTLKRRGARFEHQPVIVTAEGAIRVEMAYNGASTRPRAADVLRLLGQRVRVEDEVNERIAAERARGMTAEEQDAALRAMAEAGDTEGAVQLARTLHGGSLAAARARVQRLARGGPAPDAVPGGSREGG